MELPDVNVDVTGHQVVVIQLTTVTVSSGAGVELTGTVTGITETGTPGVVSVVAVSVTVFVCSGTAGVEFALTLVGGVTVAVGALGIVDVEVTTTTEGVLETVV